MIDSCFARLGIKYFVQIACMYEYSEFEILDLLRNKPRVVLTVYSVEGSITAVNFNKAFTEFTYDAVLFYRAMILWHDIKHEILYWHIMCFGMFYYLNWVYSVQKK